MISAILLLLKQDWRTSINRFAEAMTLFAVACAGLFPLLAPGAALGLLLAAALSQHDGLWPQWRSPLVWDVFAVSTYATVSLLFWYVGLIPDLATLRDRAKNRWAQYIYGFLAMGWRGSARHWHRYRTAYLLLAGLATPLVVSVHTVVRFDFTVAIVPGWHSTIFPPYFVAGAIFSGFAMVITLAIPLRRPSASRTSSPIATSTTWPRSCWPPADRGLRLPDGSLHGLVRPQSLREIRPAQEPAVRPLCPYLLDDDHVQCVRSPAPLVPLGPDQRAGSCG